MTSATGRRTSRNRSREAYTLLEICLTIAVVVMLIGVAIPVMGPVVREARLRECAADISRLARTARLLAIEEGRPYVITFTTKNMELMPAAIAGDSRVTVQTPEETEPTQRVPIPSDMTLRVLREDLDKDATEPEQWNSWYFFPSGLSEPLSVEITRGPAQLALQFSPLNAGVEDERYHIE